MKIFIKSAFAVGALLSLATHTLACGTADPLLIKSQILGNQFASTPKVIGNNLVATRLRDGTVVVSQEGNQYLMINPTFIDIKKMKVVTASEVLGDASMPSLKVPVKKAVSKPKKVTKKVTRTNSYVGSLKGVKGHLYGTGKNVVTVFVDPLCPSCHQFMKKLRYTRIPSDLSFNIVPVSVISADPDQQKAANILSLSSNADYMAAMLSNAYPTILKKGAKDQAVKNRNSFISFRFSSVPSFVVGKNNGSIKFNGDMGQFFNQIHKEIRSK